MSSFENFVKHYCNENLIINIFTIDLPSKHLNEVARRCMIGIWWQLKRPLSGVQCCGRLALPCWSVSIDRAHTIEIVNGFTSELVSVSCIPWIICSHSFTFFSYLSRSLWLFSYDNDHGRCGDVSLCLYLDHFCLFVCTFERLPICQLKCLT